ncbi:MAG: hypothetical protein QXV63_02125 [Candidatus Aenigmatarchaeota archaeon]
MFCIYKCTAKTKAISKNTMLIKKLSGDIINAKKLRAAIIIK